MINIVQLPHAPHLHADQFKIARTAALHSAAVLFFVDMTHTIVRRFPLCDGWYCQLREPMITWAALAAVLIVYFDDAERRKVYAEVRRLETEVEKERTSSTQQT